MRRVFRGGEELIVLSQVVHILNCCAFHIIFLSLSLLAEKERSIVITWSTGNKTDSIVKYGGGSQLLQMKKGSSSLFVDGGQKKASQYIHRVTIYYEDPDSLQPETKYCEFCEEL